MPTIIGFCMFELAQNDSDSQPKDRPVDYESLHEHLHRPGGPSPEIAGIVGQIADAAVVIAAEISQAGLRGLLGASGTSNVHGEEVQKLDDFADTVLMESMSRCGLVAGMASEEQEDVVLANPDARHVVAFDPLDGSSNIDLNISVGTIFSVHQRVSAGTSGDVSAGTSESVRAEIGDWLQPGRRQRTAGYVLYGTSTMLILTTGTGVDGFTLDDKGVFRLSHPGMKMPFPGKRIYSLNDGYAREWLPGQTRLTDRFRSPPLDEPAYSARYVGSLVADFHRTLIRGGIFMYPGTRKTPGGKLRLLYELAPMAILAEQAGGAASDGERRILDINPTALHQRAPVYIGSQALVRAAEEVLAEPR